MKVVRTVILSLILVFLAFVIYRAAKGGRKIPASTIRAEYRDIESKLTIPGVIQPSKEIDIKSTISGVLEKLLVQVGDEVVGGQPLAQIRYPTPILRIHIRTEEQPNYFSRPHTPLALSTFLHITFPSSQN